MDNKTTDDCLHTNCFLIILRKCMAKLFERNCNGNEKIRTKLIDSNVF